MVAASSLQLSPSSPGSLHAGEPGNKTISRLSSFSEAKVMQHHLPCQRWKLSAQHTEFWSDSTQLFFKKNKIKAISVMIMTILGHPLLFHLPLPWLVLYLMMTSFSHSTSLNREVSLNQTKWNSYFLPSHGIWIRQYETQFESDIMKHKPSEFLP